MDGGALLVLISADRYIMKRQFIHSLKPCHGVGGKDFFGLKRIIPSKDKRVAN